MSPKTTVFFCAVAASFTLSGAAALMYETLWVRVLTLYFGHTNVAVASVLAAFMAGLSLGSFFGGRLADRAGGKNLLKLFALLEIGTAVLAVATRPAIAAVQPLVLKIGVLQLSPGGQSVAWFCVSFALLLLPTVLMGATLPVLIKVFLSYDVADDPGRATGVLYGVNAFGAMGGTALAGFFLIPRAGINGSFLFGALLNLSAAGVVFALSRYAALNERRPPGAGDDDGIVLPRPLSLRQGAFILLLAGTAAMACEVAWTRAFASILGSSTYAFTIMLFTFLGGFFFGSVSVNALPARLRAARGAPAFLLGATALALLSLQPLYNLLPYLFMRLFPFAGSSPFHLHAVQIGLCALCMAVPTFLMGMLFPLVVGAVNPRQREAGKVTGYCYAVNTLGNIAGSAAGGLLLVPLIGAEQTIMVAVLLYALATVSAVFARGGAPLRNVYASTAFVALLYAGIFLLPRWDPAVISSGAFLYAAQYHRRPPLPSYREFVAEIHRSFDLLFYRDGLSSTVAVSRDRRGHRFIRTNGKTDASSALDADMPTQLLSGYLPALAHPLEPRTALIVGLGSGVTAGALAQLSGLEAIDCVEIEPSFVDAARFFDEENHRVLDDPRVRLIFADARQYLAAADRKYDVIISEPSNVWISGIANLFTREAFELSKRRLAGGGVVCQWIHGYAMGVDDFKMVLRTFSSVFPHVMVMKSRRNDFFLFGSNDPWRIDYRRAAALFSSSPVMQSDLRLLGLDHPLTVLASSFMLGDVEAKAFASEAPLHVDDRPTLEFSAPYRLYRSEEGPLSLLLQRAQRNMLPDGLVNVDLSVREKVAAYNRASAYLVRSDNLVRANLFFNEVLRLDPGNARNWMTIGDAYLALRQFDEASRGYAKAAAADPGLSLAWFKQGIALAMQGRSDEAFARFRQGVDRHGDAGLRARMERAVRQLSERRHAEAYELIGPLPGEYGELLYQLGRLTHNPPAGGR